MGEACAGRFAVPSPALLAGDLHQVAMSRAPQDIADHRTRVMSCICHENAWWNRRRVPRAGEASRWSLPPVARPSCRHQHASMV